MRLQTSSHDGSTNLMTGQSFILTTAPYTVLLPSLLLISSLAVSASHRQSSMFTPALGPTALILALFAQYHAAVPYHWRYKRSSLLSGSSGQGDEASGVDITSKTTTYSIALQLALSQLPGSLMAACVGWCIGYAWRWRLLPNPRWRLGTGRGAAQEQGSRGTRDKGQ